MKAEDLPQLAKGFLESHGIADRLADKQLRGIDHIVISFKDLIKFSPDLADALLDRPQEILALLDALATDILGTKDARAEFLSNRKFTVRFKGAETLTHQINQIRKKEADKFITVKGVVKVKSDVGALTIHHKYECISCGNVIRILQLHPHVPGLPIIKPTMCSCGKRRGFKLIEDGEGDINVYYLNVEEGIEDTEGGARLASIRVVCRNDLANKNVERALLVGSKVTITGILTRLPIYVRNQMTAHYRWLLDANYIHIHDDSFGALAITPKEQARIIQFAKDNPNILKTFADIIFPDIYGNTKEKYGIVLQMFGGVDSETDRGDIHVLLTGDPGTGKSSMVKRMIKYVPRGILVAGPSTSRPGLLGTAVKDEMTGFWTVSAGAFTHAHGGHLFIDELDKIDEDARNGLHQPLENGEISFAKAETLQTLPAKVALLAAANPKGAAFSEYDTIYKQLDFPSSLIDRFDLVFPMVQYRLQENDFYEIGKRIASRQKADKDLNLPEGFESDQELRNFIKRYVSYARRINPVLPAKLQDRMARWFQEVNMLRRGGDERHAPITGRRMTAIIRLAQAIARSKLSITINDSDFEEAKDILMYSLNQIAIDPKTGEVSEQFVSGGGNLKKHNLKTRLLVLIDELYDKEARQPTSYAELKAVLEPEGHAVWEIDEMLEKLKRAGDIFEPKVGRYLISESGGGNDNDSI